MNLLFLISIGLIFVAFAQAAQSLLHERKRALTTNFLSILQARHSAGNEIKPESTNVINYEASDDNQEDIAVSVDETDILTIEDADQHLYSLSNNDAHSKFNNYNPDFILKEDWMNETLNDFLSKNFKDGRLNMDDLFVAAYEILFNKANSVSYEWSSLNRAILSFLYEYENGVGSSLPIDEDELCAEIFKRI